MAFLADKQYRANNIIDFYNNNNNNKILTVKHFEKQLINKSVVYRIIRNYELSGSAKFKEKSGRPRTILTSKVIDRIDEALKLDPNLSIRNLANLAKISKSSAHRAKVEIGWQSFECSNAPKITTNQEIRIQKGASRIYRKIVPSGGEKILILDDESYFPKDPKQVPGCKFYSVKEGLDVPLSCKLNEKQKFFDKYLVWQAADTFGNLSRPYITKGTINAQLYKENCLKKRLIPFIHKYHDTEKILFWPDMATAHYAKDCVEYLESQKIEFVTKKRNTPNFPHGRPIELYWAMVKKEYCKYNVQPQNIHHFKRIYNTVSKRVARRSCKNLFGGTKRKLRVTRDEGAFALLKVKLPTLKASNKINIM